MGCSYLLMNVSLRHVTTLPLRPYGREAAARFCESSALDVQASRLKAVAIVSSRLTNSRAARG